MKTKSKSVKKKVDNKKDVKIPKTKKQKLKLKHQNLMIIIAALLVVLLVILLIVLKGNKKENKDNKKEETKNEIKEEKLSVYDEESNLRPYAVMIPNNGYEQDLQHGISKAYIVYEMVVEGAATRFMALFKDVEVEKIGPIRSCRHYYLDYVLENDAIYIHWGANIEYAYPDISKLNIDNIDGSNHDSDKKYADGSVPDDLLFWRSNGSKAPNNGFIGTDRIQKALDQTKSYKNYRKTSDNYKLLNYQKEVDLSKDKTVKKANTVTVEYSLSDVKYVYDSKNKYYLRYNDNDPHIDHLTDEQVHVKNIIVIKADSETIPNDYAGRQEYNNIGSGKGYYITEGKSIEITWTKESRESKTKYKDLKGNEIKVNDGNTFIQFQPTNRDTVIE